MLKHSFLNLTGQLVLSATILGATFIATQGFLQVKAANKYISVKGRSERQIESDFATWGGSFSRTAPTQVEAYELLENDFERLQLYFAEQGISNVKFSAVEARPMYQRNEHNVETNTVEYYILTQNFTIETQDFRTIERLSQEITKLIKEGLTITSNAPRYFYRKLEELKIAMLAEAASDAMQRASALVVNTGSSVGTLRSAQQGVFQITPTFSNVVSDYGENDMSSIDKSIKAVVTMEYLIE